MKTLSELPFPLNKTTSSRKRDLLKLPKTEKKILTDNITFLNLSNLAQLWKLNFTLFLFQPSNPTTTDPNIGCISRLGNCIHNNNNNNNNNKTNTNNTINNNNINIYKTTTTNNTQNNNNNECRTFNRLSVARIFCQCTPNCIEVGNESESSFDESGNKSESNFIVKCNIPKPENTRSIADGSAAVARVPVFCQFIPFL